MTTTKKSDAVLKRAQAVAKQAQAVLDQEALQRREIIINVTTQAGLVIPVSVVTTFIGDTAEQTPGNPQVSFWGDPEPDRLAMAIAQGQAMLIGERMQQIAAKAALSQRNTDNANRRQLLTFSIEDLREAAGRAQRESRASGKSIARAGNKMTMKHLGIGDPRVYSRELTRLGKTREDIVQFMLGHNTLN